MISRPRKLLLSLVVLAAGAFSSSAWADNASELEGLLEQKVVTSASKSAETTDTAPATATTITADDLARHGVRTVADAVRFLVPGAIVEEVPGGSFGSRGVLLPLDFGSHVLVLVDGHTVNSELDGSASLGNGLGVPIEMVDHVEVVLGPGSVLYGTNAMFGVVNVVTRKGESRPTFHLGVDAEVSHQYRAAAGGGSNFDLFGQHGDFTLGIEHIDMTDPVNIDPLYVGNDVYTGTPLRTRADGSANGVWGGTWSNNFARATNGYLRVGLGDLQLTTSVGRQRSNDPTTLFDFDSPDGGFDDRWLSLDLQYQKRISEPVELKVRLYGDERRKDIFWPSAAPEYCLPGQLGGCRIDIKGGAEWLGLETQARIDWAGTGRQTTLVGVDGRIRHAQYVSDIIDASTGNNPGSVAYYSAVDQVLGAYAQHVARLGRAVTLNFGSRLDAYPNAATALSPRAALIFEPREGSTFKAIYSSAFQAPLPSTMAFAQPLLVVPAGHIDNERVHSFELAQEQRLGTHLLHTSLFYSRWQDMVELVQLSQSELMTAKTLGQVVAFVPQAVQYRNAASIESFGITTRWEGSLYDRRLRYGVGLTEAFARSRVAGGDEKPITGAPALQATANVSYDLGAPWPTLGLAAFATGRTLIYGLNDNSYSTPPTVDPRVVALANVAGPIPGFSGCRYRLGARVASGEKTPDAVGVVKSATPQNPTPILLPLRTLTALAGLEYTFE